MVLFAPHQIDVHFIFGKGPINPGLFDEYTLLVSFSTGVIVPPMVLEKVNHRAYNFHPAPPTCPGREPHHFAIYFKHKTYGVTAHHMVEKVDAGPIVGVKLFDFDYARTTPEELLQKTNEPSLSLLRELLPQMMTSKTLLPPIGIEWTGRKHTRKDFERLSFLHLGQDPESAAHVVRSFSFPGYDNIKIQIGPKVYRLRPEP
ncbi:MAG: hypothetical protein LBR62_00010 [Puniceicoccales bacterium]|nr:hypothetical protein [Puniceicoccales bacterium]